MANTFAPNGFNVIGPLGAHGSNGAIREYQISASYATSIYHGDVVYLNAGYVQAGASGTWSSTVFPLGIFVGCEYNWSALNNQARWSNFWPGSGAASGTIVRAYVADDPDLLLMAQSGTLGGVGSSPVAQSNIGEYINLAAGTGNGTTGVSGMYADTGTMSGTAGTLPFRIVGLTQGNAGNGGDNTTAGNLVLLSWAAHQYRA